MLVYVLTYCVSCEKYESINKPERCAELLGSSNLYLRLHEFRNHDLISRKAEDVVGDSRIISNTKIVTYYTFFPWAS